MGVLSMKNSLELKKPIYDKYFSKLKCNTILKIVEIRLVVKRQLK